MICPYCHKPLGSLKNFCPHCMRRQMPARPNRNRCLVRLLWKPCAALSAVAIGVAGMAVGLSHEARNLPVVGFPESAASTAITISAIEETECTDPSATTGTTEDGLAPAITTLQDIPISTGSSFFAQHTTSTQILLPSEIQLPYPQVPMEDIRRRVQEKLGFDIRQISDGTELEECGTWYDPNENIDSLVNRILDHLKITYINSTFGMPMVYYLRLGEDTYGSPYIYVGTGYVNVPLKTESFDSQECVRAVIANMQQAKPEHRFLEVPYPYITSFVILPFSCPSSWTQEEIETAYTNYLSDISFSDELYIVYLGTRNITNGITGMTEERHIFASPIYSD